MRVREIDRFAMKHENPDDEHPGYESRGAA
jgi:hypothetical protein